MLDQVDILEDDIQRDYPEAFKRLLVDHTTHENIFWATDSYAQLGKGYGFSDLITPDKITGEKFGRTIQPRSRKSADEQARRVKDKAEVFTPSWVCNAQNNLIDEQWFGNSERPIFNEPAPEDGPHEWRATPPPVVFPDSGSRSKGKTWQNYVKDIRLEITCGEAPYLVSRYDTVTGEPIPIDKRIGLLDRKMRVVNENTTTKNWKYWATIALQSIYGFEWQGDNLLLAREAILYSMMDYYREKFGKDKDMPVDMANTFAYIISWNLWQMDGLTYEVPCDKSQNLGGLFGTFCVIRDWNRAENDEWEKLRPNYKVYRKPWQVIEFKSLCKTKN